MQDHEIRTVEIEGETWYALGDALVSAGMQGADRNPMFVARIPGEHRQQVKLDGRWTWLVTEFGADWAAGQGWRKHGDPSAYGRERAHGRAHAFHADELKDEPKRPTTGPGRPPAERVPERIANEYRRKIRGGQLPAGEKLPRVSFAAQTHSVSEVTIKRAYQLLRDEGLVRCVPGRNGGYKVVETDQ